MYRLRSVHGVEPYGAVYVALSVRDDTSIRRVFFEGGGRVVDFLHHLFQEVVNGRPLCSKLGSPRRTKS